MSPTGSGRTRADIGVYDAQDRLLSYDGTTYTYTAAGELLTKTSAGQTTTYGHDAGGVLRTVELPSGARIEYVIDGRERRVGKMVCAAPCTAPSAPQLAQGFLYADQLRVVVELDGAGSLVSRFVYGSKENVPDTMIRGGVTYRIVSDHLGSVRLVVNAATGDVAQRMDFDEWGQVTLARGTEPRRAHGAGTAVADRWPKRGPVVSCRRLPWGPS